MESGENAITNTQLLCPPSKVAKGVSVYISQNLIVVSPDPEANNLESGLN